LDLVFDLNYFSFSHHCTVPNPVVPKLCSGGTLLCRQMSLGVPQKILKLNSTVLTGTSAKATVLTGTSATAASNRHSDKLSH